MDCVLLRMIFKISLVDFCFRASHTFTNIYYYHFDLLFYSFYHCHVAIKVKYSQIAHLLILSPPVAFCPNTEPVSCVQPDFTAHTGCPHKQSLYVLHLWVTWACWGSTVWRRSIIVTQVGSLITLLWTPEKSQSFI